MTNSQETLGRRIARLRLAKAATQERLARELSVSPQAVSKWENDINYPDISLLPQLAQFLGVSIDELLRGASTQERKGFDVSMSITKEADESSDKRKAGKEQNLAIGNFAEEDMATDDEADVEEEEVGRFGLGKFFSTELRKPKDGVSGKEQATVRLGNSKKHGLHIYVESEDGDVVDMCVPLALAKFAMKSGLQIGGRSIDKETRAQLEEIDIDELVAAAKEGESGTLINIVSSDGDIVKIWFD
ncbi:transcriptional regulator [Atopobium sp. HMSC064B08]|nr:transcriptional regulator [Atopobium sp. HMSC064B08]